MFNPMALLINNEIHLLLKTIWTQTCRMSHAPAEVLEYIAGELMYLHKACPKVQTQLHESAAGTQSCLIHHFRPLVMPCCTSNSSHSHGCFGVQEGSLIPLKGLRQWWLPNIRGLILLLDSLVGTILESVKKELCHFSQH